MECRFRSQVQSAATTTAFGCIVERCRLEVTFFWDEWLRFEDLGFML